MLRCATDGVLKVNSASIPWPLLSWRYWLMHPRSPPQPDNSGEPDDISIEGRSKSNGDTSAGDNKKLKSREAKEPKIVPQQRDSKVEDNAIPELGRKSKLKPLRVQGSQTSAPQSLVGAFRFTSLSAELRTSSKMRANLAQSLGCNRLDGIVRQAYCCNLFLL